VYIYVFIYIYTYMYIYIYAYMYIYIYKFSSLSVLDSTKNNAYDMSNTIKVRIALQS
jgi:hypothetical protein